MSQVFSVELLNESWQKFCKDRWKEFLDGEYRYIDRRTYISRSFERWIRLYNGKVITSVYGNERRPTRWIQFQSEEDAEYFILKCL